MGKKTGLARQIAELTEKPPIDFDPEENGVVESSDEGSDSQDSSDDQLGTEHYVEVSKSKLRKQDEVPLGPKYAGSRVSRKALQESDDKSANADYEDAQESQEGSDFADPDASDMDVDEEDGDIDSDEAFGDGDEEKFKNFTFRGSGTISEANLAQKGRKSAADFMSASEDEEAGLHVHGDRPLSDETKVRLDSSAGSDNRQKSGNSTDEESDEGDDYSDEASDSNSDQDGEEDGQSSDSDDDDDEAQEDEKARREELRKIMNEEQKSVVATISQAAKADTEKGKAVKQQRKTFDSLLNVRIRLQKALVASNSMVEALETDDNDSLPYRAAEEAAIKLLDTLDAMRYELNKVSEPAKVSKKRKHTIELDTPSTKIWESIQASEAEAINTRQSTLEKWSARVRGATALPISSKLNNTITQQSITTILTDHLANPDRLIKRTQMPRSCAPLQAQLKQTHSPHIYDDADFYQLLLKELVDQRMTDSAANNSTGTSGAAVPHWTAVREAKAKRHVDTRASKGRKMRYTVHEKLQNFMAPEDRAAWEPEAVDRFFSTLLGRRVGLAEEEEKNGVGSGGEEVEGAPLAEEALMLFRS